MTRRGPFRLRLPVRFGDVDHASIVYYPRFFHYFHMAFEDMWRERFGRRYIDVLDRRMLGFPAVAVRAEFRRPLRFGEEFAIELSVTRVGRSSADCHYSLRPRGQRAVAAEATVTVACIDRRAFRARPLPPDVRRVFERLSAAPSTGTVRHRRISSR